MAEREKILHGYAFPDLVLYQKDNNTLSVRDEVDGNKRFLEAAVNPLDIADTFADPARVDVSRVDYCRCEPAREYMSLPQLLGFLGSFQAKVNYCYVNATFVN